MNTSKWMQALPDASLVSSFTIPGTHDSATYTASSTDGFGFVKTQDLSISDQLAAGCRFLDIRCRLFKNNLVLHHGAYYLHLNFDDVIGFCSTFLQQNPSECILMSLKNEYDTDESTISYEQAVQNYIAKNPSLWSTGNSLPALGSVRGKIVLLRRFDLDQGSAPLGIPLTLGDNTSGNSTINSTQTLYYEDYYNPGSTQEKEAAIQENMGLALGNTNANNFYLTFTSGYIKLSLTTPAGMAAVVNPWLQSQINQEISTIGTFAIDFVTRDLCVGLIATNFPAQGGYLWAGFVANSSTNTLLGCPSSSGTNWYGGNILLGGQASQCAPSFAIFNGRLYAAYVANNSTNTLLVTSTQDGRNWSPDVSIGQSGQFSPSLAVFNGKLFVAFVANNRTNTLVVCSSPDGQNWSGNTSVGQSSSAGPSLAAFNQALYVAFTANNGTNTVLTCSSSDGINWSSNVNTGQSCKFSPAICAFNGQLYAAFVANNGTNTLITIKSTDGIDWTANSSVNQASMATPALAAFNGSLYLAFVANSSSNALLVCSTNNGTTWSGNISIGGQLSKFGPTLAAGMVP